MTYQSVFLTPSEIMSGALAGVMRNTENLVRKVAQFTYGNDGQNAWQSHIEGCLAEMALAKFKNVYWSGKGSYKAPDVDKDDVRCSSIHTNRLIIHPEDPDTRLFWFLTGLHGEYRIHGCILGGDAKRPEWWSDPQKTGRAAFFVPREALHFPEA